MNERRRPNQKSQTFGRRSGEFSATAALKGVMVLIISTGVGAYLSIGLQQLISAYDHTAIANDPSVLHDKSVFPLALIAIAIGAFGGKAGYWIVSHKRFILSAVGIGLLGGFGIFQLLAKTLTGNDYYVFVLGTLAVVSWVTFAASGGLKKLSYSSKPRPGMNL